MDRRPAPFVLPNAHRPDSFSTRPPTEPDPSTVSPQPRDREALELLKVVDPHSGTTLEILPRDVVHRRGLWHRVAHVWVAWPDEVGRSWLLFQRHPQSKPVGGGLWGSAAGGHVAANESPLECALRELIEETGLGHPSEALCPAWRRRVERPMAGVPEAVDREIQEIFGLRLSAPPTKGSVVPHSPAECDELAAFPVADLERMLIDPSIPLQGSLFWSSCPHGASREVSAKASDFMDFGDDYFRAALTWAASVSRISVSSRI